MFALLMGLKTIAPSEVLQLTKSGQVMVVAVNSHPAWTTAHVPGAVSLDPLAFRDTDLPTDKQSTLVFYCSNRMCRKAPNAARRAKKMGYFDVRVMSAGINGWLAAKMPTEVG